MHNSQEGRTGNAAGQASDHPRLQVDHKGIAEALVHECHTLVVRREVSPLAEVRKDLDIGRKVVQRGPGLALRAGVQAKDECEREKSFHCRAASREGLESEGRRTKNESAPGRKLSEGELQR